MPTAVLSAFCFGRRSCLVVDLGHSAARASAVFDGHELRQSRSISPALGGEQHDILLHSLLMHRGLGMALTPLVAKRQASNKASHLTPALLAAHRLDLVRDIKCALSFIPHYRITDGSLRSVQGLAQLGVSLAEPYTLPDGTTVVAPDYDLSCAAAEALYFDRSSDAVAFLARHAALPAGQTYSTYTTSANTTAVTPVAGRKRSRESSGSSSNRNNSNNHDALGEALQQSLDLLPASLLHSQSNNPQQPPTLSELIVEALHGCDVSCRRDLLPAVALVGGQSLLPGLPQRLQHELDEHLPLALRPKLLMRPPLERRFSSWIGGSILGICGSFQQIWVSRRQYEEEGADRILSRHFVY